MRSFSLKIELGIMPCDVKQKQLTCFSWHFSNAALYDSVADSDGIRTSENNVGLTLGSAEVQNESF